MNESLPLHLVTCIVSLPAVQVPDLGTRVEWHREEEQEGRLSPVAVVANGP